MINYQYKTAADDRNVHCFTFLMFFFNFLEIFISF